MIKKFLLLVIMSAQVFAMEFAQDFLKVKINLQQNQTDVQNYLIKKSLQDVFVKITGNSDVVLDNDLKVKNFIKKFSYNKDYVEILFDAKQVLSFIHDNGYSVWGGKRPKGLLWLVDDDSSTTMHLNDKLKNIIAVSSKFRGVDVSLIDLNDDAVVIKNSLFARYLLDYGVDYNLVCNVSHFYAFDNIDCSSAELPLSFHYEVDVDDYAGFLTKLINKLTDKLVETAFAGDSAQQVVLQVKIDGISNYAEVKLVEKIISLLPGVESFDIKEVSNDLVVIDVKYMGGLNDFASLLDKDARFLYKDKNFADHSLNYKWVQVA